MSISFQLPTARRAASTFFAIAAVGAFAPVQAAPPAQSFAVRDVRVFDGERVLPSANVVVRDGLIVAVGATAAIPAGLDVVDGHGKTLLPGLIDAHTHSFGNARRDAIRFGVTTELDMFGDWHQIAAARAVRERIAPTDLADLWSAGTLATAPHGHGTEYGFSIPTLTTPAEAAPFVAARLAEGSDYVKIILEDGSAYGHPLPTLDAPTVDALVAAAHAAHRLAVAHVATEAEADTAIAAHVDGLAHVFVDRVASPAFIARAKSSGAFVVATLSVAASTSAAEVGRRLADDPRMAPWLSAGQRDGLRAAFPAAWQNRDFLANATASVRALQAAGVPILAGTDAGNPGTAHGASLHGELALLVAAGLSPQQALAAATAEPARRFGLADRGRIAAGQRADLVLVDGDPTHDIEATRAIAAIWKNGAPVDRALAADELAGPAGAALAGGGRISDFDDGAIAVRFGQNWSVTTDALIGGKSVATQAWTAGGADGSRGAMRVAGTIDAASPFPWAGTLFMPGAQAFAAVDLSEKKALVFKVRSVGDGRGMTAMWFSGAPSNRQPSMVRFATTGEWTAVRIALDRFVGADPTRTRAIAITAGAPAGDFAFEIDDVGFE